MTKKFSTLKNLKLLFTKLVERSKDVEEAGTHLHINSSVTLGLCLAHQSKRVEGGGRGVPPLSPRP